ncbi:MAG: MFS transporter [Bryobacterales bacterium]|nr:MFS transporter [Bryobacterales bacterium]
MTRYRWLMLALIFAATTVNYLDRIALGVVIKNVREDFHISDSDYGHITAAFQFAYMVGFLLAGWLIDRIGTKAGYAISIAWWSVAAILHGFANGVLSLAFWRGMLGLGEAGNFPSAIKAVAEWFPKKDRALATGIFNAGTNVASMVGPPIFAWMVLHLGWRDCFYITGGVGIVWLFLWLAIYQVPRKHAHINQAELEYIESDPEPEGVATASFGWRKVITFRQTWGFATAKFFSDPVWWFYLFWIPPYLYDVRKFNIVEVGWTLPVIYLMADFGSVFGGWLSGYLIRRGMPNARARKTAMLSMVLCMPVAALCAFAPGAVLAVALVSLATAAHQGWSANLFTTTSDVFPKQAVASVTGFGGAVGAFGGVIFTGLLPGYIVQNFGYVPMFLIMGTFHLIAFSCVQFFMKDMKPVAIEA